MKRSLFAIFLAVMLIAALVFAVAPSAKAEGETVFTKLEADAAETLIIEQDTVLDLAGFNATVSVKEGVTLSVIDTSFLVSEDELELSGNLAGDLTVAEDNAGTIASVAFDGNYRYLKVENKAENGTSNGTYSFHPFNLTISGIGLNTISGDICLRVSFIANNVVRDKITDYGVEKLTDEATGEFSAKAKYSFGTKNGIHTYYDLDGSLAADKLDTVNKFRAYMVIGGEKVVSSYAPEVAPRQVLKTINKDSNVVPTDTQVEAITTLVANNAHLSNLFTRFTGAECVHQGGTATCTALAVCIDCDEDYGALSAHSYTTTTIKAGVGSDYGYDRLDCSACGHSEKTNWTRHILDKTLTNKEIAALAALTPEDWAGKANLSGAGQWFYKLAGVDVSSVLDKTIAGTKSDLFGGNDNTMWLRAGNTSNYAKMMISGYYGSRDKNFKHAQFVAADFQIGDLFCAKGTCATCAQGHYMTAVYQGDGRFLSVVNCGGTSTCEASCDYDTTTVFAEDFFAQTDVATWDYYYVLRPNMLVQLRDMAAAPLTDAEKEAISNISATDLTGEYSNLKAFANEVYKIAGVDTSAYINQNCAAAYTSAFAAESSVWTTMLLPESWGGSVRGEDVYALDAFAFEVGDIISGKRSVSSGSDYWTAIYQGDGNFLVQSSKSQTVKAMTLTDIFATENMWEYYFVLRPDQLASAE